MAIWVTGIGVVSPLGSSARETMDRLVDGDRGFAPLRLFTLPGARADHAAQVAELRVARPALPEGEELSRTDRMAIVAAAEALAEAGLGDGSRSVDLALGGTTAGLFETESYLAEMARDPSAQRPRRLMLSHPLSSTVDRMRLLWPSFRHGRSLCSACSSAANAVLLAAGWLETGRSERVLAGGADGLCRLTYAGFHALGALSPEPCRPFDRDRRGLSLGEGAAFLLLETEQAARKRGAVPLVELRGWAVGSECHHITNPEPSGATAARVMRAALYRAKLDRADIDYVNAHGTGTVLNDTMEIGALRACFGAELERLALSSSKGQIGHTIGAAGAVEAAITALALVRGVLPPTGGLCAIDPSCLGPRHLREAERQPVRAALSSSFGFGGTDTALVLALPGLFASRGPCVVRRVVVSGAATIGPLGIRSGRDVAAYLDDAAAAGRPGRVELDASAHLDVARARRIDRMGRLVTVVAQAALRRVGVEANAASPGAERSSDPRAGAIVGSAYGPVDGSAAFVQRVHERGARGAVPAAFPNLVPSSAVAHAAIYLGLGGPVWATSDLGTTAEMAVLTALELIEANEADLMVAGGVEELGAIVQSVLAPLFSAGGERASLSEGGAVVVLESAEGARARRAADPSLPPAVAEFRSACVWRGDPAEALRQLASPCDAARARVVSGQPVGRVRGWLGSGGWSAVPVRSVAERTGEHAAVGGFALAAALALLEMAAADEVLVIGAGHDRGCALVLSALGDSGRGRD